MFLGNLEKSKFKPGMLPIPANIFDGSFVGGTKISGRFNIGLPIFGLRPPLGPPLGSIISRSPVIGLKRISLI